MCKGRRRKKKKGETQGCRASAEARRMTLERPLPRSAARAVQGYDERWELASGTMYHTPESNYMKISPQGRILCRGVDRSCELTK